jgi:hypothetical protein
MKQSSLSERIDYCDSTNAETGHVLGIEEIDASVEACRENHGIPDETNVEDEDLRRR